MMSRIARASGSDKRAEPFQSRMRVDLSGILGGRHVSWMQCPTPHSQRLPLARGRIRQTFAIDLVDR